MVLVISTSETASRCMLRIIMDGLVFFIMATSLAANGYQLVFVDFSMKSLEVC